VSHWAGVLQDWLDNGAVETAASAGRPARHIHDPLFSRICEGREIREIKGTQKFQVLQ